MFSYSGLTKDQMVRLRNEFGVYGTDTGRMCVAALNSKNIDYVCAVDRQGPVELSAGLRFRSERPSAEPAGGAWGPSPQPGKTRIGATRRGFGLTVQSVLVPARFPQSR